MHILIEKSDYDNGLDFIHCFVIAKPYEVESVIEELNTFAIISRMSRVLTSNILYFWVKDADIPTMLVAHDCSFKLPFAFTKLATVDNGIEYIQYDSH